MSTRREARELAQQERRAASATRMRRRTFIRYTAVGLGGAALLGLVSAGSCAWISRPKPLKERIEAAGRVSYNSPETVVQNSPELLGLTAELFCQDLKRETGIIHDPNEIAANMVVTTAENMRAAVENAATCANPNYDAVGIT